MPGQARLSLVRQSPLIRLKRGPARHHELLLRARVSASPDRSALPGTTQRQREVSTVELLVARCAGLDVAKDEVVACVRVPDGHGGRDQEVRTF